MRWLITGADGFVAAHLIAHLLDSEPDDSVWGMVWRQAPRSAWPPPHQHLHLLAAEITDAEEVVAVVQKAKPDVVLHLASASSVAASWQRPAATYEINVLGQLNLLEAARRLQRPPTVVIASSAEIYGPQGHGGEPIPESSPLNPASPYAVTKAAQDLQAAQYFTSYGLATIRLRLFNHTGPGRPPHFVVSSFAKQIAEINAGYREPVLRVGNLDVSRDFTDVRDVVRAWRLAALVGIPGEAYNVCSGQPTVIRTILEELLKSTSRPVDVQIDPELLRNGEIDILYGDPSRFAARTGWRPEIPLEQTLGDLLDWWNRFLTDNPGPFRRPMGLENAPAS